MRRAMTSIKDTWTSNLLTQPFMNDQSRSLAALWSSTGLNYLGLKWTSHSATRKSLAEQRIESLQWRWQLFEDSCWDASSIHWDTNCDPLAKLFSSTWAEHPMLAKGIPCVKVLDIKATEELRWKNPTRSRFSFLSFLKDLTIPEENL